MGEEREEERRFDIDTTLNKIWRDIGQILWESEKEKDFLVMKCMRHKVTNRMDNYISLFSSV